MKSTVIKFIVCTISILIIGCSVKPKPEIISYGILNDGNMQKAALIDLKKYSSFRELVYRAEQIACDDSIPTIALQNSQADIQIGFSNRCKEDIECRDRNTRNILIIQDEKIHLKDTLPMDSLGKYMSIHYNNNNKLNQYSESPEKAKISILYKDLTTTGLKSLLLKIIESYEGENFTVPLIITFDMVSPPAPPPPPKTEEYEIE